ncbi:MAG: hypothetical protein AB4042_13605 [Leptolyngbyaceae cyanobacterium]
MVRHRRKKPSFDIITFLFQLIIRGTMLGVVGVVLLLSGILNPLFVWRDEQYLMENGALWASQVMQLDVLQTATVESSEVTMMGMQGDGSRAVRLKLDALQSQQLMEQIVHDSHWESTLPPSCTSPENPASCERRSPSCYVLDDRLMEGDPAHESRRATFCPDTDEFRLLLDFF